MGKRVRTTPSFSGLKPASVAASRAAYGASRKRDTKPELIVRKALFARGLRYRVDVKDLPGRPDIVFTRARVAVLVDGDFWHGRDLATRLARLREGHNARYWVDKIRGNVERDLRYNQVLEESGWVVLRYWESDIASNLDEIVQQVAASVGARLQERETGGSPD